MKRHPVIAEIMKQAKAAGAKCYPGDTFAHITTTDGRHIRVDVDDLIRLQLRWLFAQREKIVAALAAAPAEKRAALRVKLRGCDKLLRTAFTNATRHWEASLTSPD